MTCGILQVIFLIWWYVRAIIMTLWQKKKYQVQKH
mgnify:CR=1 FL=1